MYVLTSIAVGTTSTPSTTTSESVPPPVTPANMFSDDTLSLEIDTSGPHTCIGVDGIHKHSCDAASLLPAYAGDICSNIVSQVSQTNASDI